MSQNKDFSNLAYARLNVDYDRELFIREYDEVILPHGYPITNNLNAVTSTAALNKVWGMIPPEKYNKGDIYMQEGNADAMKYIEREHPGWLMKQLMQANLDHLDHLPEYKKIMLEKFSFRGGPSFRNETLDLDFSIKEPFKNMQMWQWIQDNLPFKKINSIHCVSIESGGFSIIHRDMKGLYDAYSSAGQSRLYKEGFVVITLNLSDGGVPLYWSLDGPAAVNCYKTMDPIYLTNDYFMHGVPIVTSRRRQVRVAGIPRPELWDLFDSDSVIDVGEDYKYDSSWARTYADAVLKGS
jgi:hypothetical protein